MRARCVRSHKTYFELENEYKIFVPKSTYIEDLFTPGQEIELLTDIHPNRGLPSLYLSDIYDCRLLDPKQNTFKSKPAYICVIIIKF